MTMNDHRSSAVTPLIELIEAVLQETASDEQRRELQTRLLANKEERKVYLHYANLHSGLCRQFAFDGDEVSPAQPNQSDSVPTLILGRGKKLGWLRIGSWAAAVAMVVIASLYCLWPRGVQPIARISGLSGALVWTGDRGHVQRELSVGSKLDGGTIEGVAPDSWFELEFNDGSTAMIAGTSMLTFSDFGQKELHLKRGNLSASVVPQPAGTPMLIHTRSAVLTVLGTRFEVEEELDSTTLHVSKGRVQIKRLSDGRTIEVPANHQVVTFSNGDMSAGPVPGVVHDWKSRLHLGPTDLSGKWLPPTGDKPASLKAIPFVPRGNPTLTLHLVGLTVNRADKSPVVVQSGSRFVVRGRLLVAADLFLGIRVARPNGDFAGKFLARQPAEKLGGEGDFEVVFNLDGFGLDPIVWNRKDELPSKPDDLVVTSVWAFTHTGGPSGLEVTDVELIPPIEQNARRGSVDGLSSLDKDTEERR